MRPIDELHQIRAGLFFWQGYDPAIKTDLGCCAIAMPSGLLFVDPLPLAPEPLAELAQNCRPAGIVLTNANHERAAANFAHRFDVPVYVHSEARGEVSADHWLDDGATVFESARAIHLPGFAKGEIALHCGDCMLMGDALINVEPHSFAVLPDKYCADPKLARQSLRRLLDYSFEIMTFAHGLPIVSGARRDVENLLNT